LKLPLLVCPSTIWNTDIEEFPAGLIDEGEDAAWAYGADLQSEGWRAGLQLWENFMKRRGMGLEKLEKVMQKLGKSRLYWSKILGELIRRQWRE
jgi:hypothetical protein